MSNTFIASYESMARAEIEARANGWDGESGGFLDYVNGHYHDVGREFKTRDEAEAWLKEQTHKSLFGSGYIDEIEHIEPRKRCTYCTCRGKLTVRAWLVTDEGIEEERGISTECAWDD